MIPEGRLNPDGTVDVPTFDANWLRYLRTMRLAVYVGLALGDVLGLTGVFLIAGAFVVDFTTHQMFLPKWSLVPGLSIVPMFVAIAIQRKPWSSRFLDDPQRASRDTMSALITAGLLVTVLALRFDAQFWRSAEVVAQGTVLGAGWLVGWHGLAERIVRRVFKGQPTAVIAIIDDIAIDLPYDFPTIFAGIAGLRPDRNDPAALDALASAIAGVERVIVACSPARRALWIEVFKGANVQGELVLPEVDSIGMLRTARAGPNTTAVVALGALDTTNRIVKRTFDLAVALGALVLVWPVLVLTAIAVKLDSPGQVLFRQPRVGRGNRLFNVYKFRSMRTDMCDTAGAQSTGRIDPRITRVGAFIRKTSIDELPQIFNVISGSMSIVGPRPHAVASKAAGQMFWEVDERYWHRHAIKPGITGLAQVSGWRGTTETADDLTNRVAMDTAYMLDWTVWRDVEILLRTVTVPFHKNAY